MQVQLTQTEYIQTQYENKRHVDENVDFYNDFA